MIKMVRHQPLSSPGSRKGNYAALVKKAKARRQNRGLENHALHSLQGYGLCFIKAR